MRNRPVILGLLWTFGVAVSAHATPQDETPPAAPPAEAAIRADALWGRTRSPLLARSVAAVTDDPAATAAAMEILRGGGSAADAAVAAAAVMGVTRPASAGPGADLVALYWDSGEGKAFGLSAVGPLPSAGPAAATDRTPEAMPGWDASRWTVPAAVDGWSELHSRFGRKTWEEVLGPALFAADKGVPIAPASAFVWSAELGEGAPSPGSRHRSPELAATYGTLSRLGRAAFYEGELASKLVELSGGSLSPEDLATYRSEWVEPVFAEYRGHRVWQLPPPSRGVGVLQALNVLSAYDIAKMGPGSPAYVHLVLEAGKLVQSDSVAKVGDAAASPTDVTTLLSAEYAGGLRRGLDPNKAAPLIGRPRTEATSAVVIVDAEGDVCCLVTGLGKAFGAGLVTPLGFAVSDGLGRFGSTESVNAPAAGRRPAHDLMPTLVTSPSAADAGKTAARFMLASSGRSGSAASTLQTLVRLLDFGEDVQTAVDRPRPRAAFDDADPLRPLVSAEVGLSAEVREALIVKGHVFGGAVPGPNGVLVIAFLGDGVVAAATDPRADATAAGL